MSTHSPCTLCAKFFGDKCDGQIEDDGTCNKQEYLRYDTTQSEPVNVPNHKEGKDRMLILFEYFPDALP